eukprot:scaffold140874_cov42-Prasinocladus_malaysianus.AAC.1
MLEVRSRLEAASQSLAAKSLDCLATLTLNINRHQHDSFSNSHKCLLACNNMIGVHIQHLVRVCHAWPIHILFIETPVPRVTCSSQKTHHNTLGPTKGLHTYSTWFWQMHRHHSYAGANKGFTYVIDVVLADALALFGLDGPWQPKKGQADRRCSCTLGLVPLP